MLVSNYVYNLIRVKKAFGYIYLSNKPKMSVTQPNITITVEENAARDTIQLLDTTGIYDVNTNPYGYGLPGGPAVNDVTTLTIRVTMNALAAVYFQYVFTLVSGAIDTATLSLNGATPADITTDIEQTEWPFTTAFNLFGDYGVSVPTYADDVYTINYTVAGEVSAEAFEFLVTKYVPISTEKECCIASAFADLPIDCACAADTTKRDAALNAEATKLKFQYAGEYGRLTEALNCLTELDKFCSNCGC